MGGQGYGLGEHFQRALQEGFKHPRAVSSPNESRVAKSGCGGPKSPPEALRGTAQGDSGFSPAAMGDPRQLHVMDGPLFGVFSDLEGGSRALLWKLLASVGKLTPVWECLVQQVLQGVPK